MSDMLRVTTPPTNIENAPRTQPVSVNNPNIQNIADPTKVTRPDGQGNEQKEQLGLSYDSNYGAFLTALRDTPNITETFSQLFFQLGIEVNDNVQTGLSAEFVSLLKGLDMTEEQLLDFVKEQASSAVKFGGNFFEGIDEVLKSTNSPELQREIINFVKTFNAVDSSASTLKNIKSILQNLTMYMTSNYKIPLEELTEKLNMSATKLNFKNVSDLRQILNSLGENPQNTALLKKEIIPFLSNYIKQTNNMGKARDLITMLTLNVAKYETGNMEKLLFSFSKLMDFRDFKSKFSNITPEELIKNIVKNTVNKSNSDFTEQFINVLKKGVDGKGGWETKAAFRGVINSFLLNQSVYMPLSHFIVPAGIDGKMLFSEIWVDHEHNEKNERGEKENCRRMLIKFDVKDVGFFDLVITQHPNEQVDLQLFYPEQLSNRENEIKKDINNIMGKNGIDLRNFAVNKSLIPKKISEVFPRIYERINAVDVKI